MRNSASPLLKIPIKFGVFAALLSIAVILVMYFSGKHPLLLPPYLDSRILIFLIFIYFAIREYKDNFNGGLLHFWEGMILGIVLYVFAGLMGGLFIYTFSRFQPEFVGLYISQATEAVTIAREQLINGQQAVTMTQEEFEGHLASLKETTASILAVDYFIKTCIVGFFIPLFYSVVFRKTDRQ